MITAFDKNNLKVLSAEIETALAAIGEKHGITIKTAGGSYTDETVTFKLDCIVKGEGGVARDKHAVALERFYPKFVGKEVTLNSKTYTVVGYNTRGREYPFIIKDARGQRYKATERDVGIVY